ncbi:uncharacterized protein VP01_640g3 [Puccinia sorghi]|uniref:SNF2 N-terminal domain-containing protein n=1 Tax=Puccinia sorghi TaxID=27349 RepID=A0A0L6UFU7_9BASI|nr:uncharacterized protein VP01_640g3 [Puccinia sorghi]
MEAWLEHAACQLHADQARHKRSFKRDPKTLTSLPGHEHKPVMLKNPSLVDTFLARKTGDQIPKTSIPRVIMNATLIASPTPTSTLMVIFMLFTVPGHSAEVINLFEANSLHVKMFKGYRPEECWGIPHSLHVNLGKQSHGFDSGVGIAQIIHAVKILELTLKSLALIVASKDAAEVFPGTRSQNAKATLVICPLSTLSNWEAEIHNHLDLNLAKYAVYHGEERQNWICSVRRKNGFASYWMRPSNLICDSTTKQSREILALETQMECHWWPVENKGDLQKLA